MSLRDPEIFGRQRPALIDETEHIVMLPGLNQVVVLIAASLLRASISERKRWLLDPAPVDKILHLPHVCLKWAMVDAVGNGHKITASSFAISLDSPHIKDTSRSYEEKIV